MREASRITPATWWAALGFTVTVALAVWSASADALYLQDALLFPSIAAAMAYITLIRSRVGQLLMLLGCASYLTLALIGLIAFRSTFVPTWVPLAIATKLHWRF